MKWDGPRIRAPEHRFVIPANPGSGRASTSGSVGISGFASAAGSVLMSGATIVFSSSSTPVSASFHGLQPEFSSCGRDANADNTDLDCTWEDGDGNEYGHYYGHPSGDDLMVVCNRCRKLDPPNPSCRKPNGGNVNSSKCDRCEEKTYNLSGHVSKESGIRGIATVNARE
ncbi:uncharacterized protein PAC_05158 [Phialocephala subalpina]|uniref:Uncharacterized protein n=1 Tax=Phialocephala subalpina TaxID=576137 RepID=A0A1L7WR72_9HELO|nr:uncharacterized protein PAC_05158 [Phialocephala subalpina]